MSEHDLTERSRDRWTHEGMELGNRSDGLDWHYRRVNILAVSEGSREVLIGRSRLCLFYTVRSNET